MAATWVCGTTLNIRCQAAMWPLNPDRNFACGVLGIIERIDSPPSTFSPTAPFLEPLFDADVPFSSIAQSAVAVGLLARDPATRGLAVDATITLIEDGRCTGDELGGTFGQLNAVAELVRLNRVAAALTEVARVSPLHVYVAARVAEALIAALPAPAPSDLHHLLTPLHEWLIVMGRSLGEPARALLASVKSGGKTASLAKALLALPASPKASHRQAVFMAALRGRIARAQRWIERAKA